MITWVLIFYLNAGSASTMTAIPGYASHEACDLAGEELKQHFDEGWRRGSAKWYCLKQSASC